MAEQQRKPKPFYKTKADALEDAGITPKQLRTWREEGLFTPELGVGTRYFTRADIKHLRYLRRLIAELGLPIETVRHLLADLDERKLAGAIERFWEDTSEFIFLNLETGKLVHPRRALHTLFQFVQREAGPNRPSRIDELEDWILNLAATVFANLAQQETNPDVYRATRDAVLKKIDHMDLVGRTQDYRGHPRLGDAIVINPLLEDDPELTRDDLARLATEKQSRLPAGWDIPF